MAKITFDLSGSKAAEVTKIIVFAKDKSRELVTVEVSNGRIDAAQSCQITEPEVYVFVAYGGLIDRLEHKHLYDVKITGDGTLVIGADGAGNSRVNFRA